MSEEEATDSEEVYEDAEEEDETLSRPTKSKKFGKPFKASDSEAEGSDSNVGDDNLAGWGSSRKDYYNADTIETEKDALEEEAEARRLQRKQLEGMTDADFGFDAVDWRESGKGDEAQDDDKTGKVIEEVLPKVQITDAMSAEEKNDILHTRYPEFEPLAQEFVELQEPHMKLRKLAEKTEQALSSQDITGKSKTHAPAMPPASMKYRTLSAYLASLSMYFALITSTSRGSPGSVALPPEQLREHPIMDTLLQCRNLWLRIKDLDIPEPITVIPESTNGVPHITTEILGVDEVEVREPQKVPKPRKSRSERAATKLAKARHAEAEALRQAQMAETEASLANLSSLTTRPPNLKPSSQRAIHRPDETDSSDLGDPTTLTPHEAAEKAKRKKSLRFYTSQIAQKSNRRGAAGRDAGGDADLPYRERLKDRQARLNAEAEKRGRKAPGKDAGEELSGGESDEGDRAAARELRGEGTNGNAGAGDGDEEDYYQLIASRASKKKADKAALAAFHAKAAAEGGVVRIVDNGTIGEDGKRAIGYSIEKNKGLTPRRRKEVRNPRVKKRKKYDEKMKKLSSTRPVYKGGEGRGGYGGELTGIRKDLVKGVRL